MQKLAVAVTSFVAAAAVLAAAPGSAAAQPGMTPPAPPSTAAPPSPPPPPAVMRGEPLSENVALALSLGGTAVSWGLLLGAEGLSNDHDTAEVLGTIGFVGTLVAPSFGHWYAGSYLTRGMGLRALGTLAIGAGLASFYEDVLDTWDGSDDHSADSAGWLILVGGGLLIGGTIDDIVTAPRKVRKRNQQMFSVGVAPVVTPRTAGLALSGTF
jgi:hypothetical protein